MYLVSAQGIVGCIMNGWYYYYYYYYYCVMVLAESYGIDSQFLWYQVPLTRVGCYVS